MSRIEAYLNNMEKKQKYLIYLMVFGLIIYIFVQLMMPMRDEQLLLESEIDGLQTKLVNNSLPRLKKQKREKKAKLLFLKSKKEEQKEKINHLISGLHKLKYAFYDDKEWADSMENILKYSLKRDLKIDYIKSIDVKLEKSDKIIKKKKSLEISGSGDYIDIAAFISYIDNLNTLLQFSKIKIISTSEELKFMLFIDMYGISL